MLALTLAFSLNFLNLFNFLRPTPLDRTVQTVEQSLVRIELPTRQVCTGFVVGPNTVLTAAHCVGDMVTADRLAAEVVTADRQIDLAVLHVTTPKKPLKLELVVPERFTQLVGVGYGNGSDRPMALIRALTLPLYAPTPAFLPGLVVAPGWIAGMSGGPVIDSRGRVVGIIQRTNTEGTLGYGVAATSLLEFLLREL